MLPAKKALKRLSKILFYSLIILFTVLLLFWLRGAIYWYLDSVSLKRAIKDSSFAKSYKIDLSTPVVKEYTFLDYTGETLSNGDFSFLDQIHKTNNYYAVYLDKKIYLYEIGSKKKTVIYIPENDFNLLPPGYMELEANPAKLGVFELPGNKLLIDVGYYSGGRPAIGLLYIYDIRSGNLTNICGDEICLSATDVIIINNEEFFVVNSSSDGCGGRTNFELYNLSGEKRGISKDYDVGCWLADSNAYLGSIDGKAVFLKEDLTPGPDKNTKYTGLWSIDLVTGEGKELLSGNLSDSISWGTRLIGGTSVLRVYHRETSGSDLFYFDLDSGEYISDPDVIKNLEVSDTSLYAYVDKDIKADVFSERYGEVFSALETVKDYEVLPSDNFDFIYYDGKPCWGSYNISYANAEFEKLWHTNHNGDLVICLDSLAEKMGFKVIGVGYDFATVRDPKTGLDFRLSLSKFPKSGGFDFYFSSIESRAFLNYSAFLDTKDWSLRIDRK